MKQFWKTLLWLVGIFMLYIILTITYGTFTDYQPADVIEVSPQGSTTTTAPTDSVFSFLTWNIGYAGLGASSDFFYDGGGMLLSKGHQIRPTKIQNSQYLSGIEHAVRSNPADFYLFQEVDVDAKRSYHHNQLDSLAANLPAYQYTFADNYKSSRIPLPVLEPWHVYGKVHAGLGTFSKYPTTNDKRIQLPGNYDWPVRIFQLDRCIGYQEVPLANGKKLVVMNIHNSAFDKGGKLKAQQVNKIQELATNAYEAGHYVVIGGDWNSSPPTFAPDSYMPNDPRGSDLQSMRATLFPTDWLWVFDPSTPTNRSVTEPFQKGETFVTLIDYFLISPNLRLKQIRTINYDFQYSDHQPVWMEVELR